MGVQTYLSMLCSMRWGLFFFFGGMCIIMTVTVYLFYPETKGLGIEETPEVFKRHWWALNSSVLTCRWNMVYVDLR